MKTILVSLISFFVADKLVGQNNETNELIRITKEGLTEKTEVTYDNSEMILQIGDYLFPCSTNSSVKLKQEKGAYQVEFFLQKNTAIRSNRDASYRRAWYALPFKSRKLANDFIAAFRTACSQ